MTGNRPVVLIRADGSIEIGTGHIRRCLALADVLQRLDAEAVFVTRDLGGGMIRQIRERGYEPLILPPPDTLFEPPSAGPVHAAWAGVPQQQDVEETVAAVGGRQVSGIVIDCYAFEAGWHSQVGQTLRAPVLVIDDLGDRRLNASIIVDHNWSDDHRAKHRDSMRPGARLLAGPRYALIDPAYAEAPRYRFREAAKSIGIFLGGVDAMGLSLPIARAMRRRACFDGAIVIATTSSNPRLAEQRVAAHADGIEMLVDAPNLAAFFAQHDLQIGAAGGATWERCCIGAPTLAVAVAENQLSVIEPLAAIGAVATVHGSPPEPHAIAEAADELIGAPRRRAELASRVQALVDGRGAERVALALLAPHVRVRPAAPELAELVWHWRNHVATRTVARDSRSIPLESHIAWFAKMAADPDHDLLVGFAGPRAIGVVRYDRLAAAEFEVSIYLDPELQGLGLGPTLLAAGEGWLLEREQQPIALVAEYLPQNVASRRLFERAGFSGSADRVWKRATWIRPGTPGHAGTDESQ